MEPANQVSSPASGHGPVDGAHSAGGIEGASPGRDAYLKGTNYVLSPAIFQVALDALTAIRSR